MRSLLALLAAGTLAGTANAGPITYDVNLGFSGGSESATVVGSITTDGTLGALSTANILGWAFDLTANGLSVTINDQGVSGTPSLTQQFGPALYASPTNLTVGNGVQAGDWVFANDPSGPPNFNFVVNPVVNSQLNLVQLRVSLNFPNGQQATVFSFGAVPPGGVFAQAEAPVPEPTTLLVFGGLALAGVVGYRRRKAA